ncbi:pilin [Patescibacteria group bacterium]|nr:pilin [Patescibacteria group bacterium]MBU1663128.1 pilin [Patescibacteria group bacterium]MBU1933676.1 pilin [Patescibacteria group bacterium]MBU2008113.1 pilin [Patescibacteria group bacterium]MBU2233458.1 pilin [Patescibacteria group bacterium]
MIKKYLKIILFIAIIMLPEIILADNAVLDKLEKVGSLDAGPYAKAEETTISTIVGTAVSAFLGLLGVIFLVLIIYAGFNWMTAAGEEEKVTKAKDTLRRAVIGLIIIIGAYAISFWVFDKLLTSTNILK